MMDKAREEEDLAERREKMYQEAKRLERAFRRARRKRPEDTRPLRAGTDVDFDFRPRTYFGPISLRMKVLSTVKGEARRRLAEDFFEAGAERHLDPMLRASALPDETRTAQGAAHPSLMGGEYLPDFQEEEIEIARVSLSSVTADVISVRARRVPQGISYSIVDEYEDQRSELDEPKYRCQPSVSISPLSMAEIVRMMERAGIVIGLLKNNRRLGATADDLVGFAAVTSEFYPELHDYWEARIARWLRADSRRGIAKGM